MQVQPQSETVLDHLLESTTAKGTQHSHIRKKRNDNTTDQVNISVGYGSASHLPRAKSPMQSIICGKKRTGKRGSRKRTWKGECGGTGMSCVGRWSLVGSQGLIAVYYIRPCRRGRSCSVVYAFKSLFKALELIAL